MYNFFYFVARLISRVFGSELRVFDNFTPARFRTVAQGRFLALSVTEDSVALGVRTRSENQFFWFYLATGMVGNCFRGIVLNWFGPRKSYVSKSNGERCYPAWATLTIRPDLAETVIYWRGWHRFDWNSAHIARKYGECHDAPFGFYHQYSGWLGRHIDL